MLSYIVGYVLIGYLVALYMIWHYRYHLKSPAQQEDSFLALIGVLIWPLMILKFIDDKLKKKKPYRHF